MQTFNFPVQAGVNVNTKANIYSVQFDDGYQQRQKKGIKNIVRTFSVRYVGTYYNKDGRIEIVDNSEAVIAFLTARGGYEAFNWTSYLKPNSTPIKVYCDEWSEVLNNGNIEVSMTFKEVI